jgi:hypothetical protein
MPTNNNRTSDAETMRCDVMTEIDSSGYYVQAYNDNQISPRRLLYSLMRE